MENGYIRGLTMSLGTHTTLKKLLLVQLVKMCISYVDFTVSIRLTVVLEGSWRLFVVSLHVCNHQHCILNFKKNSARHYVL